MTATLVKHSFVTTFFLTMIGLAASLLVFLSFFAPTGWSLELLTHFRLQYSLILAVVATGFLTQKRAVPAFLVGVFFVMNSILLTPFYLPTDWRATATNHSLDSNQQIQYRVLFANINYGNQNLHRSIERVEIENPDLLITVETDTTKFDELTKQLTDYPHSFQIGRGQRLGTAIWSKQPFLAPPTVIWDETDTYPTVRILTPSSDPLQPLVVYAIHPPPPITPAAASTRNEIFSTLANHLEKEFGPILVVGDFNASSWSPQFNQLLQESGLNDSRLSQGIQPSWPTFLPSFLRIPIDHVLISTHVQVLNRQTLPSIGSDHLPVLVEIRI